MDQAGKECHIDDGKQSVEQKTRPQIYRSSVRSVAVQQRHRFSVRVPALHVEQFALDGQRRKHKEQKHDRDKERQKQRSGPLGKLEIFPQCYDQHAMAAFLAISFLRFAVSALALDLPLGLPTLEGSSTISRVAILATCIALRTTSAGRVSPLGPRINCSYE